MKQRLGIQTAQERVLPQEFDFREQALLYVPARMPDVRDASFRRGEDLSSVDIKLMIAFSSRRRYYQYEQELDRRGDCQLISASSE